MENLKIGVACQDCEHRLLDYHNQFIDYCLANIIDYDTNPITGTRTPRYEWCQIINKNLDCKDYKKAQSSKLKKITWEESYEKSEIISNSTLLVIFCIFIALIIGVIIR